MTNIDKIAVIGSGVMGAAIAAHVANSGTQVLLFDIVPDGVKDRSEIAKGAIETLLKTDPAPLIHKRRAKLITPCNLEDDLAKLGEVDWIIEAVIERLDIKQSLYEKLEAHRKKGSVVSSNTSTLPLNTLTNGLSDAFKQDFLISHFFNPPRYMRLLELVGSAHTRKDALEDIRNFCDVKLGKGVVECKDTPGFIANRIGVFWLAAALKHALEMGVDVETADAVMGKPVGIPKTGVFGLMDLIGIDLLPLIAKSFADTLDPKDRFFEVYHEHDIVTQMIAEGYTGRKGKGGFYRLNREGGAKVKESKNLATGEYAKSVKPKLASVEAARGGLRDLVTHEDAGGHYAWAVLKDTLSYAASLVPEISDDIARVDEAMRLGYNWKYGPFELIDRLGADDMSGTKWFSEKLAKEGMAVPEILAKAGDGTLYVDPASSRGSTTGSSTADAEGEALDTAIKSRYDGDKNIPHYLTLTGDYAPIHTPEDAWMLADKKRGKKPVLKNPSASVWDVGDGILCLEFTSKMNSLDLMSLEMVNQAVELVQKDFKGLIIGNDADNFCVGANIGLLLFVANVGAWKQIEEIIKTGQDAYMALKYAPFPVVGAPSGMALGGGCEMLMHCDAVNAHVELYTGLVEVGVGIVPGWGGCKEMIYRQLKKRAESDALAAKFGHWFSFLSPVKTLNTMPALEPAFRNISTARVAKSAEEAQDMLILNERSRITMNRKRVLADAKALCLELAEDYVPPHTHTIHLPGKTARTALDMAIRSFEKSGKATKHDVVVSKGVGQVLSGGETDITKEVSEQDMLDLERDVFMELVKHPDTLARIEHMLETGKPLRN